MFKQTHQLLPIFLLLIVGLITSCLPNRLQSPIGNDYNDIPFNTIDQATSPFRQTDEDGRYQDTAIATAIIIDGNHAKGLGGMITVSVKEELANLDYDSQSVFVLFAGWHHFVHTGVDIQQISYQNNQFWIQADNLFKGGEKKATISSPYQVVSIEKSVDWQSDFPTTIVVSIEGHIIISHTAIISDYTFLQGEPIINSH